MQALAPESLPVTPGFMMNGCLDSQRHRARRAIGRNDQPRRKSTESEILGELLTGRQGAEPSSERTRRKRSIRYRRLVPARTALEAIRRRIRSRRPVVVASRGMSRLRRKERKRVRAGSGRSHHDQQQHRDHS
jgi:hypothetical protein